MIDPHGRPVPAYGPAPSTARARGLAYARSLDAARGLGPVAEPVQNLLGGAHCPPVVCRRLKPGELHPFEWWDGVAGRWCRGREVPAATLALLPTAERERYEAHLWRWIGMQAEGVHPCPRA